MLTCKAELYNLPIAKRYLNHPPLIAVPPSLTIKEGCADTPPPPVRAVNSCALMAKPIHESEAFNSCCIAIIH